MEATEELKKIKKIYGEKFMHLCRNLFPTILETEGKLLEILSLSFGNNSRTLYQDIVDNGLEEDLKRFVYSKIDVEDENKKIVKKKTPYELLEEAGYRLFECKSEKEIQSFKKYYAPGEELCTFNGGRLNRCEVFFAVKKDVDEIRREDFSAPKREDRYGTSVMGIQFNKYGLCTVSIKNRYNHRVNNPDATYGNNLDRIVTGLEQSFGELLAERGLELNTRNVEEFMIPGYVVAADGRYYKYNMEIGGIYYCPGNIVIENGEPKRLKDNEILIDNFVLDTKEKTLKEYMNEKLNDSFVDAIIDIEKIEIVKNDKKEKDSRSIIIKQKNKEKPTIIDINKDNEIIGYTNEEIKKIGNNFLCRNKKLEELNLPQLQYVGNDFLSNNDVLTEIDLPQLQKTGDNFLSWNEKIRELNLSQLHTVGSNFLAHTKELSEIDLPQLKKIGRMFLRFNNLLKKVNLPNVRNVEYDFLLEHSDLIEVNVPSLENERVLNRLKKRLERNAGTRETLVNKNDLAILDKGSDLTTAEIGWGKKIIGKIKTTVRKLFNRNDDRDSR